MTRPTPRLAGLIVVVPSVFRDGRGFFLEAYSEARYRGLGIATRFVQDNHSRSTAGTVRGLHFQSSPGQPKLVRAARGRVWDVVVDIRRSSPTFGEWEAFDLNDDNNVQLYIPVGFAHGFCALSDVDFVYKVGSYYDRDHEHGIAWDDPDLAIPWPVANPIVSERDARNPRLRAIADELPSW